MISLNKEALKEIFGEDAYISDDEIYTPMTEYQGMPLKGFIGMSEFDAINKCLEWLIKKGYFFGIDTAGHAKLAKSQTIYKFWEDEEYNPCRVFDACEIAVKEESK